MKINNAIRGYLFIIPAILFLFMTTLYPILLVVRISFLENYFVMEEPHFIGLQNYLEVLKDKVFWISLMNTVIFTGSSVVMHLSIGLALALLLNQRISSKVRNIFRGMLLFPWLIPSAVAASIWVLLYQPLGMLNASLMQLGVIKTCKMWLGNPSLAMLSIIVVNVWWGFPLYMVTSLAGLQTIPNDIYEASALDGASTVQKFWYITIPGLRGVLLTMAIFDIIWTFKHFDLIFLMTGGGPLFATEILGTYTYTSAFKSFRFSHAAASGIIMLLISLAGGALYLKLLIGRESK